MSRSRSRGERTCRLPPSAGGRGPIGSSALPTSAGVLRRIASTDPSGHAAPTPTASPSATISAACDHTARPSSFRAQHGQEGPRAEALQPRTRFSPTTTVSRHMTSWPPRRSSSPVTALILHDHLARGRRRSAQVQNAHRRTAGAQRGSTARASALLARTVGPADGMEVPRPGRRQLRCHARPRSYPREVNPSRIHADSSVRRIVRRCASVQNLKADERTLDRLDSHVGPVVLAAASDGHAHTNSGPGLKDVPPTPYVPHPHILPDPAPALRGAERQLG